MTVEVAIKERPIIFSGPMVRAILEGRKTQTRRVIKPQPGREVGLGMAVNPWSEQPSPTQAVFFRGPTVESQSVGEPVKCPFGRAGDRLWVREAHAFVSCEEEAEDEYSRWTEVLYKADYDKPVTDLEEGWRPSIHMPMWATRIMLEITNIKVERVQDISLEDIEAEGTPHPLIPVQCSYRNDGYQRTRDFKYLWNEINDKRGYGWEANPWVWVVEFKKIG